MQASGPRIRSLLREAQRAADAGKRAVATKVYRQIIEEAPEAVPAWLGLAEVVQDPAEREAAYRQALALEPDNEAAQQGLVTLAVDDQEDDEPEAAADGDPFDAARYWAELETAREWYEDVLTPSKKTVEAREAAATETAAPEDVATPEEEALYCANHPNRPTSLRCNRCGRAICSGCARTTPVGYRCPQCIREAEDAFYNATVLDYVVAAVVSLILGGIAAFFVPRFGFFVIFIAAFVGSFMGNIIFRLVGRRRGRWLPHLVVVCIVTSGLLTFAFFGPLRPAIDLFIATGTLVVPSLRGFIWLAVYLLIAPGAAYYQMK